MRVRGAIALQERFITDAAHQLRTPLAGLQLHAERAMAAQDPAQLQQSLAHILAQTARAARASNQLLALSRAQAPHPGGEMLESLALDRLVPHAVAARVPEALDAGLDLGYQPPEAPVPAIVGEARGVQELLDNLIDNALRYAGAGRSITVGVSAGQAWVILSVEDDGPGVPDALRARLGERFFRVPGAGGEGTGLGLAIVQGIASRHQAEVAFLRGAQGGLRVEVRFPVAPRPDTATDPVKHNPA
jgi:two-component system sensor histidine kinase TctE